MSLEAGLVKLLTQNQAVSDLVAMRVFPLEIPENTARPAICYTTISTAPEASFDSTSELDAVHMQIDALADTYADVLDLKRKIRGALENFSGTVGQVEIQTIICTNDRDMDEPTPIEPKIYHRLLEFSVFYTPPNIT